MTQGQLVIGIKLGGRYWGWPRVYFFNLVSIVIFLFKSLQQHQHTILMPAQPSISVFHKKIFVMSNLQICVDVEKGNNTC